MRDANAYLKSGVVQRWAAGLVVIAVTGVGSPAAAQTSTQTVPPSRLKPALSLQAKLFFSKSASFSADVLAPNGPELVNVVARDDPSGATLVLVAVALPGGLSLPADSHVRLVALAAGKGRTPATRLLDSTVRLGVVGTGGTTHLGFWLPATGCRPVQLRATLTAARQSGAGSVSIQSLIPFACGE